MYTIKQAALRSGVNVALLRAWERRYGIVAPTRSDGGYRLYDDDAIARLRAMRALVDDGWSARQAAARVTAATAEELDELRGSERGDDAAQAAADTAEAFVSAAARIDAAGIERALDDMFATGTFERVVEDRLYPALRALGEGWSEGVVDVAGEHAASAAAVRRLSMAFEAAGTAVGGDGPILVGLPPGVRHEVAVLSFATALRRAGLPVIYIGADVPVRSWIAAAERTRARAVAFGVSMDDDVASAREVMAALHAALPDVVVAVGGRVADAITGGEVVRLPDELGPAVEALRRALG
jgi:MerR family transcriptional regulator, light-induced transcriptional regulator